MLEIYRVAVELMYSRMYFFDCNVFFGFVGFEGKRFFPSSLCSRPNFLEELGRKRLLRRLPVEVLACTDLRDDYGSSEK